MISLSFNEIEQLCQKAARGAGLSWGLAEEAGMAAVWLVKHGIDGPKLLSRRLQRTGLAPPNLPWGAQPHQAQCPIILGAALCDFAPLAEGQLHDGAVSLGLVSDPALLMPFLARMSDIAGHGIEITWDNHSSYIQGAQITVPSDFDLFCVQAVVRIAPSLLKSDALPVQLWAIDPDAIQSLNVFAMRTNVPASVVSRAGAGAVSDDD